MTRTLIKLLLTSILAVTLAACSDDPETIDIIAPHTANEVLEEIDVNPYADEEIDSVRFGLMNAEAPKTIYVYASQVRARSTPELVNDNILGYLFENDELQIVNPAEINGFVEVKVLKSVQKIKASEKVFVAKKYLSSKPVVREKGSRGSTGYERSQVFMIQNVATEILRVYKRNCNDGQCAHELILETDIAVGEDNPETRTSLGYFHFNKWVKFYQDHAARYPSWYDPLLPDVPKPGAPVFFWLSKKLMPNGGNARGAFGWFTAFPGPNADGQWTHGTFGWGKDKKKYIEATRGFWTNLFTDPRSHGCTRTDNESIAYLRHIIPVGTPLLKIYAKEAYLDSNRSGYSKVKKPWQYILTKNGVRVDGEQADRQYVLSRGTPKDQWIEEGTYLVDAHPDAKMFKRTGSGKRGRNGNVYELPEYELQGVFLVDAGLLVDYRHPSSLKRIGYADITLPPFVVSKANPVLP